MAKIKLVYSCALVLVFNLSLVYSQYLQTPCPDIFSYENDGYQYYGKIIVAKSFTATRIQISVEFQVLGNIRNVGSIQLVDGERALKNFNQWGVPLQYQIFFPQEALSTPQVTLITVNDVTLCNGPGITRRDKTITTYSLVHTATTGFALPQEPSHRPILELTEAPTNTWNNNFEYKPTYQQPSYLHSNEGYQNTQNYYNPEVFKPRPTPSRPSHLSNKNGSPQVIEEPENQIQCGKYSSKLHFTTLILQGDKYPRGQVPWLVAIFRIVGGGGLKFVCGGTLVSNKHVVTAAHCLYNHMNNIVNTSDLLLALGVHSLQEFDSKVKRKRLSKATIHEGYDASVYANDIAVLTLKGPVKFDDYIRPACLWTGDTSQEKIVGLSGLVAGWGRQSKFNDTGALEPRRISLPIVSTEVCQEKVSAFRNMNRDTFICAGDLNGGGPCDGDSGSGLFILHNNAWGLRGVVSLAALGQDYLCDLSQYVAYTDSAKFLPWIKNIINEE